MSDWLRAAIEALGGECPPDPVEAAGLLGRLEREARERAGLTPFATAAELAAAQWPTRQAVLFEEPTDA